MSAKWGVNVKEVKCPSCGTVQPRVRKPKNMRQFLSGGNTCAECGIEMDKYGVKVEK